MFLKILRFFGPDRPRKGSDHKKKELKLSSNFIKDYDKLDLFTIKHFQEENFFQSTVHKILMRNEDGIPAERQNGSGTTAKIMTKSDNIYFDQTLRKPAKVYLHYE
jgi:hypothetical protein